MREVSPQMLAYIAGAKFISQEAALLKGATFFADNFNKLVASYASGEYLSRAHMESSLGWSLNRMVDFLDEWEELHVRAGIDALLMVMGDPRQAFALPAFRHYNNPIQWDLNAAEGTQAGSLASMASGPASNKT